MDFTVNHLIENCHKRPVLSGIATEFFKFNLWHTHKVHEIRLFKHAACSTNVIMMIRVGTLISTIVTILESILVAQFIHAYVSEEYGETTETNKTNKYKQLGSKGLIQTINIVIYTLSISNNQTPLWLPMA